MAYVFDPINNTLIDDEDKSLGNKFALNDDEFQKLLDIPGVFKASEAPQPPQRPDVQEIEMFNRFNREYPEKKAEGGSIRQNFVAAGLAVPFAPALTYPVSLGLAKIFGLTTAGLGAKELGDNVLNYIKENPQVLDTPQAKAAMMTFGIVPENIKDTFFSKKEGDDKKNLQQSDDKKPNIEPPEDPLGDAINTVELATTVKDIKDIFNKVDKEYIDRDTGYAKRISKSSR